MLNLLFRKTASDFSCPCRRELTKRAFSHEPVAAYSKTDSLVYSKLNNRSLVRLKGEDILKFLQGLVTNDVRYFEKSASVHLSSMYAFVLNTQGRVLYDILLYNRENNGEILLECDRSIVGDVKKTLAMYRLRKKIDIDRMDDELDVFCVYENCFNFDDDSSAVERKTNLNLDTTFCCPDPRLSLLGHRVLLKTDQKPKDVFSKFQEAPEDFYHSKRYSLGVGEGSVDLPTANCFPLESNGDYLNGISFHKGCYVGQELTARTHHTGVVRKRLMPLRFTPNADERNSPKNINLSKSQRMQSGNSSTRTSGSSVNAVDSSTTTDGDALSDAKILNENNENIGKFRNAFGDFGLALLRVEEAMRAKQIFVKTQEGTSVTCKTAKPRWWMDKNSTIIGEIHGFNPVGST